MSPCKTNWLKEKNKSNNNLKHFSLGRVAQRLVKLTRDLREFWFEFCAFWVLFSVYIVCPSGLSLKNLKLHKTTWAMKEIFVHEKWILRLTFNSGLEFIGLWTNQPWILCRSCFHFIPLSKRKIISLPIGIPVSRVLIPCHMHATSYLHGSFICILLVCIWFSLPILFACLSIDCNFHTQEYDTGDKWLSNMRQLL